MIRRAKIANFKSIGSTPLEIEFAPLTLLFGDNGTGKSSILEAVALLAQAMEKTSPNENHNDLDGRLVFLDKWEKLHHQMKPSNRVLLEIEVSPDPPEMKDGKRLSSPNFALSAGYRHTRSTLVEGPCAGQTELSTEVFIEGTEKIGYITRRLDDKKVKLINILGISASKSPPIEVPADQSWYLNNMAPVNFPSVGWTNIENIKADRVFEILDTVRFLKECIADRIFFLGAPRSKLCDTEPTSKVPDMIGSKCENTLSLLNRISSDQTPVGRSLYDKIAKWTNIFSLAYPSAYLGDSNTFYGRFIDSNLKVELPTSLSSYGAAQIFPVILQIFYSKPGSTVIIEEPETSLHPRLQNALPELFAEALSENKQVIVSTHSEILPLSVTDSIRNGLLKSQMVKIYHVTRSTISGATEIGPLPLADNGNIEGWIPSFNEVEDRLLKNWAKNLPDADDE